MTKIELVKAVAEKTGIDQPTAMAAVEGVIDTLKESLINKESVFIRGWGTWTLKHRAPQTARNISKNTTIVIPEHNIPASKPSKVFVGEVKDKKK